MGSMKKKLGSNGGGARGAGWAQPLKGNMFFELLLIIFIGLAQKVGEKKKRF